jgi:hypothetical protein
MGSRPPERLSRRAKHPVKPSSQKHSVFQNFGFMAYTTHPGPAKGAFATVTTCGPGLRWTRQRRRGLRDDGAGNRESHATRYDTARLVRVRRSSGGEHTRAPDDQAKPPADGEVVWS